MIKQIDLQFKDAAQHQAFADACQSFVDQNGHFPTHQVIIYSVIDGTRWLQERNQVRAAYQMLLNSYQIVCDRNKKLEKQLEKKQRSSNQRRA